MDNNANKLLEWFTIFSARLPDEERFYNVLKFVGDIIWNKHWRLWCYKDKFLSGSAYRGKIWLLGDLDDIADAFLVLDTEAVSC